jgi:camphor 5-monooxygenase
MELATNEIPPDIMAARPGNVPEDRVIDFDVYRALPDGADLHEDWQDLLRGARHSVMWTPHNGGHWIALRGELADIVMADSERFSSRIVLVPKDTAGEAYKLIPLSLDPPDHRPFRKLLNDNLSPKALTGTEQRVTDLTVELIEGFKANGRCEFVHDFAEQLPVRIFMQVVDLPVVDLPKLKHLSDQYTRPDGSLTYPEVKQLFTEYLGPVIAQRRGGGGTDLISKLINGNVDGRELNDQEAIDTCIQVLVGGLDTVVNAMSFTMAYLAQDHDVRDHLAANPDRLDDAVWEFLRRFPLVSSSREVRSEIEFEGVQLKPGDMVMAPTAASALDPAFQDRPMEIDVDRRKRRHSVFGKGTHTCPGAYIARIELRIMLREWLARIPDFHLAEGARIEHANGIVGTVKPFTLEWTPCS